MRHGSIFEHLRVRRSGRGVYSIEIGNTLKFLARMSVNNLRHALSY